MIHATKFRKIAVDPLVEAMDYTTTAKLTWYHRAERY